MLKSPPKPQRQLAIIAAAAMTIIGTIAIFAALAATPIAFEPESGTLASGATTTTVTGQSGTGAVKFAAGPSPTPTPSATLMGWQLTATNIGLAPHGLSCSSLPLYTGSNKPAAGTTITGKRITFGLDLSNGNIIVEKSCIQPTSGGNGSNLVDTINHDNGNVSPTLVTVRDSELDASLLGDQAAAFTGGFSGIGILERNYIHGMGSGIALMGTGAVLSGRIENNYVTKLRAWGDGGTTGNHSDAATVRDFNASTTPSRTLVFRNNRFDCNSGNDTGAMFIQTYAGNINNVTLEGNLLEGFGYQLGLEQGFGNTYGNLTSQNNRFSGTGWGAAYVGGGTGWSVWSENYLNDPTKTGNKGAVVSKP